MPGTAVARAAVVCARPWLPQEHLKERFNVQLTASELKAMLLEVTPLEGVDGQ
jgi:hypothetical protein